MRPLRVRRWTGWPHRGLTSLLQRTVIVLNDSDGHADKRTRSILAQQFSSQGQVVIEVPFDGHLRPGGVIDGTSEMSAPTRRRFIEIAAALAEHFPTHDDRSRERLLTRRQTICSISDSISSHRGGGHRLLGFARTMTSSSETPAAWAVSRIVRLAPAARHTAAARAWRRGAIAARSMSSS